MCDYLKKLFIDQVKGALNRGSGGSEILDSFLDGSITELTSNTTTIREGILDGCESIVSVSLPKLTGSVEMFYKISRNTLESVDLPLVTELKVGNFQLCTKLHHVNIPSVTEIPSYAFNNCNSLVKIDLPSATSIGERSFSNSTKLIAVVLRNETVVVLSYTNGFEATPIASGTGYIYVPAALVDSYKAAENWSTYAAQFRALEDYTVDGTVTGELDETKI